MHRRPLRLMKQRDSRLWLTAEVEAAAVGAPRGVAGPAAGARSSPRPSPRAKQKRPVAIWQAGRFFPDADSLTFSRIRPTMRIPDEVK